MTDDTKYGDMIRDHEWTESEEEEPPETTSIDRHSVSVIHTHDPEEKHGYGRKKYDVKITHGDGEDYPVCLYAVRNRWKGNYWREVERIDWHDLPQPVKRRVAQVVACDGVDDLHPGHRLIGEGGESVWNNDE